MPPLCEVGLQFAGSESGVRPCAAAQGLAGATEVAAGALASIMAAVIYQTTNDTVVWITTSIIMIVLLVFGWILTKPPDGKPIKPDVPFDLKRRLFE